VGDPAGTTQPRRRGGKAAWTLILLAPICGELMFSAVGMPIMWLVFPLLVPMYGAGVLLVRELTVRAGGAWPTLVVLGLVYELAEDGFGLQALTSPVIYNAAEWGPRVLGFNLTYWESQVGYHIVFSVLIPVLLTDLLFPELRREPYFRRRGLVGIAATAVVGVALLRVTIPPSVDPGYQAPLPFLAGLLVVMLGLSWFALRVVPRRFPVPPPDVGPGTSVPAAPVLGLVAGAATLAFLGLLMPRGNPPSGPAFGEGDAVYLPMAAAALLAIGMLLLFRRWSGSPAMTDQHVIWAAGGALVGHTLFMVVMVLRYPVDTLTTTVAVTTGPAVILATVVLLGLLARRVAARPGPERAERSVVVREP
jgi:hypothetical protein